jgi:acetylornithine deacetylase
MTQVELYIESLSLLKKLIATPSFSTQENFTADILINFFESHQIPTERLVNNVFVKNKFYQNDKPTILLNSHHDTVKPNASYTLNPFEPIENDGKLFGLGSNDAGGSLVSLVAAFLHFYNQPNLKYNIILAATSEEEISGKNGIELLLPHLGNINFGIVGEPTNLQMAVAERGLMVVDCEATGTTAHAATSSGNNALYSAVKDIDWIKNYQFNKVSELLGETKMTVTSIETENKAHNIVPANCKFIVDIRVNELYTFDEILATLATNLISKSKPRSTRLKSTSISLNHPIVKTGLALGLDFYGSPTTSDKALMSFPTLKIGPGESVRSHIADEFIFTKEIENGISTYINIIQQIV